MSVHGPGRRPEYDSGASRQQLVVTGHQSAELLGGAVTLHRIR